MQARPKIKLELTTADKIFEFVGWISMVMVCVFTISNYEKLPDIIPIHFGADGHADGYGRKLNILLLPFIATVLFIGLTILNRFPHVFNYPTYITEENAYRQYTNATRLIRYLKFIIVIIFGIIAFQTCEYAKVKTMGLGVWFLPLIFGLIFIPLTYFLIKMLKEKDKKKI
ncbi:MAG: DUF1648 domain-containing protein [Bacteroidota bacterium]